MIILESLPQFRVRARARTHPRICSLTHTHTHTHTYIYIYKAALFKKICMLFVMKLTFWLQQDKQNHSSHI